MKTVSIVIPVYNSEATLEPLCEALKGELETRYRLQLVLVEDGSTDGSAAACTRLHERFPETVTCVFLSRNFGEHNAVMAGLNHAEGDYCVIMDDDFQNPPAAVPRLIEELRRGHDVVYVRYETKQHALWRNVGSRLHNALATFALGKPAGLYLSSFKAMTRFLVGEVIRYTGPDPYVDGIILRTTRRIGVVSCDHLPRKEGTSSYTLGKLFGLWGNMIVAFSIYPLRLVCAYGFLMAVVGAVQAVRLIAAGSLAALPDPDSLERLNATIWFFRGSTLMVLGIIGEYVGRIYRHLSLSPQFIVRETLRRQPRDPAPRAPTLPPHRPGCRAYEEVVPS